MPIVSSECPSASDFRREESAVIHEFAIYGISQEGAVLSTEWYLGVNENYVRLLARERLRLYPIVEVLEGASLVVRLRRTDSRDRAPLSEV